MITIDSLLFEMAPGYRVGYAGFENVDVRESPESFWAGFNREVEEIKEYFRDRQIGDDPAISGMRRLYKNGQQH